MEFLPLIGFLIIGTIAGLGGGLLGLSGGVIAVPCLVLLFNLLEFPQAYLMHLAIGTSLSAMILTTMSSTIAHNRRGSVKWDLVMAMTPGVILGCLLGAFVAHFLSSIILEVIFGLFICYLGAYVLLQKKREGNVKRPDKTLYTWIGLGIGTMASLLGIGGGTFMVPLFMAYRYPEKKAVGTSSAISFFITTLAAFGYLYFGLGNVKVPHTLGFIYLPAFALIGFAAIFTAPIGVHLAHKLPGKQIRRIFAATLLMIGVLLIFR